MAKRLPSFMAIGLPNSTSKPDVVAGHAHFGAAQQVRSAGHVRRAEVELRTVAAEERRVTAAFLLAQDVDFALELGVRRDRFRGGQHLAALARLPSSIPRSSMPTLSPAMPSFERLVEHFDAGARRFGRVLQADDFAPCRRP